MAEGKYYDESGDFERARDFEEAEDRDRDEKSYSEDNESAAQNHNFYNRKTVEDNLNPAGFGKFGRKENKDTGQKSWGLLKKGEKDASRSPNSKGMGGDSGASLGEKEDNIESDNSNDFSTQGKIRNAVKGAKELKSGNFIKAGGRFKRSGPFFAILAIILCFCGASFFGQASMASSLMAQINETFDSISPSQAMRSKNWLRWQTAKESGKVKDCIKAHIFKADEFKVTKRQRSKLAKSGITFEEDPGGFTVMKHTGADGKVKTIVADPKLATDGRVSFESAFENDVSFRTSYSEGSRTWRGSVSAWFDKGVSKLLNKLGVKRGVWRDYKSGKQQSPDDFRSTVADVADSDSARTRAESTELTKTEVETDDGKATEIRTKSGASEEMGLSRTDVETDSKGRVKNTDGVKTKLNGVAKKISGVSNYFEIGTAIYCGVQDFVAGVNAIVAAYQTMQIIKVASAIFEGIQKGQIADSDSSPINEISTSLTRKTSNTYQEVKKENIKKVDDENAELKGDINGDTRNRSAMESSGIKALYSGGAIDMSDPSVKSFNVNSKMKDLTEGVTSILNLVEVSAKGFRNCATARLTTAAAGALTDAGVLIGCVATAGIGCAIDAIVDQVGTVVFSASLSLAISVAVSFLVPHVAKVLTRKIATEVAGEDLGNAIVSGGNILHGQNHRSQGGAVASKESYISYLQAKDVVIAEEARFERESRSPFDTTSKYTFLGSLASKLIPLASSMTSLTSAINGASGVVGSAFNALTPKSSAVSAGIEAQVASDNTKKYCPDLADIGGVGDGFCNPYIITDVSTMGTQPAEIVNSISKEDLDTDGSGNPVVVKDSKLAKYIIYCGQRSSPFGIADQNIVSEVAPEDNIGGTIGNAILGAIPIVGDGLDVISNKKKLSNIGWITGESCVVNNTVGKSLNQGETDDSAKWDETKLYQRFIEDQRLAEAEGLIEESAVTKFISNYYEENPIDTSFEGILARYSGQTKETVEATLAVLGLAEWIAEYDPSELMPYYDASKKIQQDDNNIQIEQNYIVANNDAIKPGQYYSQRRLDYYYTI